VLLNVFLVIVICSITRDLVKATPRIIAGLFVLGPRFNTIGPLSFEGLWMAWGVRPSMEQVPIAFDTASLAVDSSQSGVTIVAL
jgi:hypothetical protein